MIPLSSVKAGNTVCIKRYNAGRHLARRLEVFGCLPGETVKVTLKTQRPDYHTG